MTLKLFSEQCIFFQLIIQLYWFTRAGSTQSELLGSAKLCRSLCVLVGVVRRQQFTTHDNFSYTTGPILTKLHRNLRFKTWRPGGVASFHYVSKGIIKNPRTDLNVPTYAKQIKNGQYVSIRTSSVYY